MEPYVIKRGDFLARLAHKFGFDADTVWNDPANADLKQLRRDPNLLWPTDILYIPESMAPATFALVTGQTNTFVSDVPTTRVVLRFSDPSCASKACSVPELPELTELVTDGTGTVSFDAPVTLDTFSIVFSDPGQTYKCGLGYLNPIDTLSGAIQRLQNLGYLSLDVSPDENDLEEVRSALRMFKAESSGNVDPTSDTADTSRSQATSNSDDNAGIDDDGRLDDETSQLLVAAHGV